MKKMTLALLIFSNLSLMANTPASVDFLRINQNVELLSIVFRLAGHPEYNSTKYETYTKRVAEHFAHHQPHPLIGYTQQLRQTQGISYDAVISMALSLDAQLNPLVDFSKTPPDRWNNESASEFTRLLKLFYQETRCVDFFKQNQTLFDSTAEHFQPVIGSFDTAWITKFFGESSSQKLKIIVSLGTGDHCYCVTNQTEKGKTQTYVVIGTWAFDGNGIPAYSKENCLPFVVHEYAHSFVNPLLAQYENEFEAYGNSLYPLVKDLMVGQAYGKWQIMLNEALVRAIVIKYLNDHNFNNNVIANTINQDKKMGFGWVTVLAKQLYIYEHQRSVYPTFEHYIPQLLDFYKNLSAMATTHQYN
jgi:hypothetical protein